MSSVSEFLFCRWVFTLIDWMSQHVNLLSSRYLQTCRPFNLLWLCCMLCFLCQGLKDKILLRRSVSVSLLLLPLSPNINMHTLLSGLYTFLMSQVGRIGLKINRSHLLWSCSPFSWPVCTVYALSGGDIVRRSLMQVTIEVKWVKHTHI